MTILRLAESFKMMNRTGQKATTKKGTVDSKYKATNKKDSK